MTANHKWQQNGLRHWAEWVVGFCLVGSCGWGCARPSQGRSSVRRDTAVSSHPGAIHTASAQVTAPLTLSRIPLINAVNANNLEKAQQLLAQGANVNAKGEEGWTALMFLLRDYRPARQPMLRLLLQKGADVQAQAHYGSEAVTVWDCFYWGAEPGFEANTRLANVQVFVSAGLNIKKDGGGLLAKAAFCGDKRVIAWLIHQGIDVHRYGPAALRSAAFWGQDIHYNPSYGSIDLLIDHGAYQPDNPDCREAFIAIAYAGQLELTQQLLALGAGRHKDDLGEALYGASGAARGGPDYDWGSPEVVKLLLQHGAPVNPRSKDQESPLFPALLLGSNGESNGEEIVRILLKQGADVNTQDSRGITPLMIAATQNEEQVRLLLRYGANPNAKSKDGRTPLNSVDNALVNQGKSDIIRNLLKQAGAKE